MRLLFGHRKKPVRVKEPKVLHFDHLPVPVHLFIERRSNSRISLLKEKIHVRLPVKMPAAIREAEMKKLIKWAQSRISKKGIYNHQSVIRDFINDSVIQINHNSWALKFSDDPDRKTFSGRVDEAQGEIILTGPFSQSKKESKNMVVKRLLSRTLSAHYINFIIEHVSAINDKTFGFRYNSVRLKYMTSRWGSCSSKRNINLSLRILMLPDRVRDYIIVHELAHLSEMNHSPKFWQLVATHVPDYKQIEKWLRQNGKNYDL